MIIAFVMVVLSVRISHKSLLLAGLRALHHLVSLGLLHCSIFHRYDCDLLSYGNKRFDGSPHYEHLGRSAFSTRREVSRCCVCVILASVVNPHHCIRIYFRWCKMDIGMSRITRSYDGVVNEMASLPDEAVCTL